MRLSIVHMPALRAWRGKPWAHWATVATVVLVPMLLAGFLGMVIGLGSPQLTLIVGGAVGGLALLFVPTSVIVFGLLGLAIAGVGTLMYYGGVAQAHWVPYALSLFLWVKLPLDALARPQQRPGEGGAGLSLLGWGLVGLFAVAGVSALVNATPMLATLVGARNYLYIWSIAFVVASGALSPAQLRGVMIFLLGLVALQGPFAVQQHFVAFGRTGNWDAVVGTFGGNPDGGGGGSGDMVMFLCFGIALAVALWKHRQLGATVATVAVAAAMCATLLAETKAFFVFAPAALTVVLLGEMRRRPALTLSMLMVTGVLLASTLAFYKYAYFDSSAIAGRDASIGDYFDYALSADSKTADMINPVTGEVSRIGAPLIWLREGGVGGPHGWLVGYGPRASNVSALLGKGEAARHFAFNLTTSTVTTLLWDVGLLGLAVFCTVFAAGGIGAWRLSRLASVPVFHRASLEAVAGAFLVALASLLYNPGLIDGFATQAFYAFAVGYVMYWQRAAASAPPAGAA